MALKLFDRFPGGNARVLELRQPPEAEVVFTPDPRGGAEAMWFDFCLEDQATEGAVPDTLTLTLRFFSNLQGGGGDPLCCRPVVRQTGKNWQRLSAPVMRHLPDGQPLQQWQIPYPVIRTEIALGHPYGPDDLRSLLQRSKGYWHEAAIGLTGSGKMLTRLDNQAQLPARTGQPRGLYLLARQVAGETPGSWVLDGLLDGVARRRGGSPWCVRAVPFADLDGVLAGDYGRGVFPVDPGRAAYLPPRRHEEVVIGQDMRRWAAACRPELILELHAPDCSDQGGMSVTRAGAEGEAADRATQAWINVLQQNLSPEFAAEPFVRPVDCPPHRAGARADDAVSGAIGCPVLRLAVPYACCGATVMTPKQYREAGRRVAHAILNRW